LTNLVTERWQEPYRAAVREFDPVKQRPLIDQARIIIFECILELCDLSDSHSSEQEALDAALRELWKLENRTPD
jgi:hypothetical protein